MANHKSGVTTTHAHQVLLKAIETGRTLDVLFPTKAGAVAFRFQCYKVKTRERKIAAEYQALPVDQVRHEFDSLSLTIVESGDKYACRVQHVDINTLEIVDAETGNPIEMDDLSLADLGLDFDEEDGAHDTTDAAIPMRGENE